MHFVIFAEVRLGGQGRVEVAVRNQPLVALIVGVAAFFGVPATAFARVSFVQDRSNSGLGTSLATSYSSNVTAGDLLVGYFGSTDPTSVSDSQNGTWTRAAISGVNTLYYKLKAAGGSTTVTTDNSTGTELVDIAEYSGVSSFDTASCGTGTGSIASTPNVSGAAGGEFAFGALGDISTTESLNVDGNPGEAWRSTSSNRNGTTADGDYLSTPAASGNMAFNLSDSPSGGWGSCIALFAPSTGSPPSDTAQPTVSGTTVQGNTLTTTNGSRSASPTSYSYQWQRCDSSRASCSNISGATRSSYTLASGDVGHTIRSVVTAITGFESSSASSAATAQIGASTLYVSASGSGSGSCNNATPCTFSRADAAVQAGQTVSVASGSYTGPMTLATSGRSGAPITWKSATRNGAHISASSSMPMRVVYVEGAYVNVEGFDISASGGPGTSLLDLEGATSQAIGNYVHDLSVTTCDDDGGEGLDLGNQHGSGQKAYGNIVKNIGANLPLGSCHTIQGIYLSSPNDIADNNISIGNQANGLVTGHPAARPIIANNVLANNGWNGIDPGDSTTTDGYVVNNITYRNAHFGIQDCCGGSDGYPSGMTYIDNLNYGNAYDGDATITTGPGTANTVTGTLTSDPMFVNPSSEDYRLRRGSPAIDSGTATEAPSTDYAGIRRPQGSGYDRGAYEQ